MSEATANLLVEFVLENPHANMVFAIGETPTKTYQLLADKVVSGAVQYSTVRLFQLDEYLNIPPSDRRSFYRWLSQLCIKPLGISTENVLKIPYRRNDITNACLKFEEDINKQGGIDVIVLGLGPNAHLGFNEPGSSFNSRTRVVQLSPESIISNAAYWGSTNDVPPQAVTMGLGTILEARKILLLVSGKRKANILAEVIDGQVTTDIPASCLNLHPSVSLLIDKDAAQKL